MHDRTILTKSDVPTSDAKNHMTTQKKHELLVHNWRATAYAPLETIRFSFLFGYFGTIPD